jgi:hypothetical protein
LIFDVHCQHSSWAEYGDIWEGDLLEQKKTLNEGNACIRGTYNYDSGVVVYF